MNFLDQIVLNFFTDHRVEWLSFVMLIITYCGSYVIIGGLTLLSSVSFYINKHGARALAILVSVGGSAITVFILKQLFDRERPLGAMYTELSSSFPSGHATFAMALYGFFLYTIWDHDKHHLKNPFITFLTILIILIGVSRLYLGVHYISDVLAGYIIGFGWLLISHSISKSKFWRLLVGERL